MLLIEDDDRIDPNTVWKELIITATVGAAWLFALIGGDLCERVGRKWVILIASVIFTTGAIVMGLATNKEILLSRHKSVFLSMRARYSGPHRGWRGHWPGKHERARLHQRDVAGRY